MMMYKAYYKTVNRLYQRTHSVKTTLKPCTQSLPVQKALTAV